MDWTVAITVGNTIVMVLTIVILLGTIKKRCQEDAVNLTELSMDVKYIKEALTGYADIQKRVILTEQSTKELNKRIDDHLKHHNTFDTGVLQALVKVEKQKGV